MHLGTPLVAKGHPLYGMSKATVAKSGAAPEVGQAFVAACNEFVQRFSMTPDKLQARLTAAAEDSEDDENRARISAEAGRNTLRNTVFPRRGADRRPPDSADEKVQAFADFAAEFAGRPTSAEAATLLSKARKAHTPRAMAAREFAAQFYDVAGSNVDLLVRNGGGWMYLLAGCLAGKAVHEMFATPMVAMLGPQVKEFVSLLARPDTDEPSISVRKSREKS